LVNAGGWDPLSVHILLQMSLLRSSAPLVENTTQDMVTLLESIQRRAAIIITSAYKCTKHKKSFAITRFESPKQKDLIQANTIL